MTVGRLARRLLGERWFPVAGRIYRRIFVDLAKVATSLPALPQGAHVLDIGAGEGELENHLLSREPSLTATLVDLSPNTGIWLSPDVRPRTEVYAGMSVLEYSRSSPRPSDVIILSDVVHHIRPAERPQLFDDIRSLLSGRNAILVVKDIEPGHWRAKLSFLADRYISGDKNVVLVSRAEVRRLVEATFPDAKCEETKLLEMDSPNYSLVFLL